MFQRARFHPNQLALCLLTPPFQTHKHTQSLCQVSYTQGQEVVVALPYTQHTLYPFVVVGLVSVKGRLTDATPTAVWV